MSQDRGPSYGRRQTAEPRKRQSATPQQPARRTALDEDREEGVAELRGAFDEVIGKEHWKRSKFRYFLGAGLLKGSWSSLRSGVGGSLARGKGFYQAAMGQRSEGDINPVLESDAGRRFAVEMVERGVGDEDINKIIDNTCRGFWFYAAMAALIMVVGGLSYLYSPPSGQSWRVFDTVFRFMLIVPMAALAFRNSYTNWLMRRRRYDTVRDYFASGDLLPRKANRSRGKGGGRAVARVAVVLIAAAIAFAAVGQGTAFAQTTGGTPTTTNNNSGSSNPNTTSMTGPQDIFQVPDGSKDLFMKLMSFIAPNTGPVPGLMGQSGASTPAHSALASAFMAFISALFFIATMQVAWHTISGIVATAQEGKVLGQRWHQVWAPTRVVTGVGFLAPAFNGFCVAQIVVLYLMAFGGHLANLLWTPYVDTLTSGIAAPTATETQNLPKMFNNLVSTNEIVHNVFTNELCYAVLQQNYNRRSYSGGALPANVTWTVPWTTSISSPDLTSTWNLGSIDSGALPTTTTVSGNTMDYGPICGSIEVPTVPDSAGQGSANNNPDMNAMAKFSNARKAAIDQIVAAVRPLAQRAGQSYQNYQAASASGSSTNGPYFATEASQGSANNNNSSVANSSVQEATTVFQTARDAYNKAMTDAATQLVQQNSTSTGNGSQSMIDNFKQMAKDGGWATAGLYYMTLSRIQGSLFTAANEKPKFISPNPDSADEQLKPILVGNAGNNQPGALTQFNVWWNQNIAPLSGAGAGQFDPNGASVGLTTPKSSSMFESLMNMIDVRNLGTELASWSMINPLNAMGDITLLGHKIITRALWLYGAYALAAGGLGAAGLLGGVANVATGGLLGSVLTAFMTPLAAFFMMLITLILGFGIVLAYVIPMIPYIMVLFFIIGMLTLMAEALIAAPLWAFFHCRMDGQEFVDQVQRPGYMIAFNLLFRPTFMLLGLFMSFFVQGALTWFLSVTFGPAVAQTTSGFGSGPIAFTVLLGIFAYLNLQIAIRSFQLITQVPDRVTRWFGYGGENLGEDHEGKSAAHTAIGVVSARGGQVLQGAGAAGALRRPGATPLPKSDPSGAGGGQGSPASELTTMNTPNTQANNPGNGGGTAGSGRGGSGARTADAQVAEVPDPQASSTTEQSNGRSEAGGSQQYESAPTKNSGNEGAPTSPGRADRQSGGASRGASQRGPNPPSRTGRTGGDRNA
jgi:conjugal transfer/type IV secretion protein DotA/TraY